MRFVKKLTMPFELKKKKKDDLDLMNNCCTVEPVHNGQIRSQTKSTVRRRWPLRETATYQIIFMDRIKKKSGP